jgi:CBS domain-containing protein
MIGDFMKRRVYSVPPTATVHEAVRLVVERHIGTLPVVDDGGRVVGVVLLRDLLGVFLPEFLTLLDNLDFVHDFGALAAIRPEDVPAADTLTMRELMRPAVTVGPECELLHAFAALVKHDLTDLLVVDDAGKLVGVASRVDIAVAFLGSWAQRQPATSSKDNPSPEG